MSGMIIFFTSFWLSVSVSRNSFIISQLQVSVKHFFEVFYFSLFFSFLPFDRQPWEKLVNQPLRSDSLSRCPARWVLFYTRIEQIATPNFNFLCLNFTYTFLTIYIPIFRPLQVLLRAFSFHFCPAIHHLAAVSTNSVNDRHVMPSVDRSAVTKHAVRCGACPNEDTLLGSIISIASICIAPISIHSL